MAALDWPLPSWRTSTLKLSDLQFQVLQFQVLQFVVRPSLILAPGRSGHPCRSTEKSNRQIQSRLVRPERITTTIIIITIIFLEEVKLADQVRGQSLQKPPAKQIGCGSQLPPKENP